MGGKLKSTLDIVMEKLKGMNKELPELNESQKGRIAEIKRAYEAKIAEIKILIQDREKLPAEILKLEERREREIEKVYSESR
jgi:fructose-1,6-bisphosphatase/sedoheptulose 1,7-bisphosphatase-like protein